MQKPSERYNPDNNNIITFKKPVHDPFNHLKRLLRFGLKRLKAIMGFCVFYLGNFFIVLKVIYMAFETQNTLFVRFYGEMLLF